MNGAAQCGLVDAAREGGMAVDSGLGVEIDLCLVAAVAVQSPVVERERGRDAGDPTRLDGWTANGG